jgi:hypothetical protein
VCEQGFERVICKPRPEYALIVRCRNDSTKPVSYCLSGTAVTMLPMAGLGAGCAIELIKTQKG